MAMSISERFNLKRRILERVDAEGSSWNLQSQNLLLQEFGLPALNHGGWGHNELTFADSISEISDSSLIEMGSIVLEIPAEEVVNDAEFNELGNWHPGYIRLFMSHSTVHRKYVGDVERELAVVGIHGFKAHDSMTFSRPWQAQIEQALRSMQAFVGFVHPEFNASRWCNQEVGWALGRQVPHRFLRLGADPAGFPGHDQWPSWRDQSAKEVAEDILTWISDLPELGESMVDGLLSALAAAGNYFDAGAASSRIAVLNELSDQNWRRLDAIYRENDQVRGCILATNALKPSPRPGPGPARPAGGW